MTALPRRSVTALLLATALAIAGAPGTAAQPPGAKMFSDDTYQELQPYAPADRLIAVLRCEAVETLSPGSRSERQQIRGKLLAGPANLPAGSDITLARYAQGKPLMKNGSAYLIAAYREAPNAPWALVEHREVEADAAARELKAATDAAARRLGTAAPR